MTEEKPNKDVVKAKIVSPKPKMVDAKVARQQEIARIKRLPMEQRAQAVQQILTGHKQRLWLALGQATHNYENVKGNLFQNFQLNVNKTLGTFKDVVKWKEEQDKKHMKEISKNQKEYVKGKVEELVEQGEVPKERLEKIEEAEAEAKTEEVEAKEPEAKSVST